MQDSWSIFFIHFLGDLPLICQYFLGIPSSRHFPQQFSNCHVKKQRRTALWRCGHRTVLGGLCLNMCKLTEATERSPIDDGDDNSWGFSVSPSCSFPISPLWPMSTSPTLLSLVKVITSNIFVIECHDIKSKLEGEA
jgi:hypothetical protein